MILGGTDLSAHCEQAVRAAAAYAKKQTEELLLVHVVQTDQGLPLVSAEVQLEQEAAELRRSYDVAVETHVLQGAPDVELLRIARERTATLDLHFDSFLLGYLLAAADHGRDGVSAQFIGEQAFVAVTKQHEISALADLDSSAIG